MHVGIEVGPYLDGEPPRWRWWPMIRARVSCRSIYADSARLPILEGAARSAETFLLNVKRRQNEIDGDEMAAHAEPATNALTLFADAAAQRCRSR